LVETIHLIQELEQNTLDLPIGTSLSIKTFCCDSVNFVNKDNGGGVLAGKTKYVADHAGSFAKVLLDKLAPNYSNERSGCMASNSFDKHCFAGTWSGNISDYLIKFITMSIPGGPYRSTPLGGSIPIFL